ncbi:MAG TPA: hypothetical protein VNF73_05125 [Candidatus Saccharimonadales bacterium]|nr:hypothetical protein [Candidatus Saccharimonadales bacterium]
MSENVRQLDTTTGPARDGPGSVEFGALVVALHVSVPVQVDLRRVVPVFGDDAPNWLGQPMGPDAAGLNRFLCDLQLRVSPDGRATFRKSTIVSLGIPWLRDGSWMVPMEWRAANLAPLFPVFVGHLIITADRIEIDGRYAPPLGVIGYALDRAVLGTAARGTARWFIGRVVSALGAVA